MIRLVGHSRNQRHGSGATANNHHPFASVIVVFRPVLRMDYVTAELVDPRNLRCVAGVVFVVSGAMEYKAGAELVLFIGCFVDGFDDPVFFFAMPGLRDHFQTELDSAFHIVFACGVVNIPTDRRAVGKHLGIGPGPKVITQGKHVGIGADAGIAE